MFRLFIDTDTRRKAVEEAPWACKIIRVGGGYLAFESFDDYRMWQNQK